MFLFPKIPKPDVPPKRHVFRLNTLHNRFLSRFLTTRQLFSLGAPAPAPESSAPGNTRRQDAGQNPKGRRAR